ncbi:MAG TPA: orotidine-5'-phosphate decarboxylase [Chitinophagales bacterium]|nr:orotidine-5'-phosphate decarboxylase [Chitinophagales bacterium]
MDRTQLIHQIKTKRSFLCVGLDTDLEKIPVHLLQESDPIFAFNKAIIDATRAHCVAYKPNVAFYEAYGSKGWESLEKTIQYIGKEHFIIADAKRGDIGNTSARYAHAFFGAMSCDAITVAPYMGEDSVTPFFSYPDKWVILLALTSNKGSQDFQLIADGDGALYEHVIRKAATWGNTGNLMYVVGATHPEYFSEIRKLIPDHFLLVPGVGAQGGDLHAVCAHGMNTDCGLLINSTRDIIYASSGYDFAQAAAQRAMEISMQMNLLLQAKGI